MSVLSRKEREKLHRRKTILSAARELFFEKGYQMTTMEEIGEKAELSKGTLYLYFDSKDELYISVILEGYSVLEEQLKKIADSGIGIEKKIKSIYFAFIQHSLKNKEYSRITQYFLSEGARKNIPARLIETINRRTDEILEYGIQVVREGLETGLFREDLNPIALSIISWRMAAGILDLALSGDPLDAGAGTYMDLFETAISLLIEGARKPRQGEDGDG